MCYQRVFGKIVHWEVANVGTFMGNLKLARLPFAFEHNGHELNDVPVWVYVDIVVSGVGVDSDKTLRSRCKPCLLPYLTNGPLLYRFARIAQSSVTASTVQCGSRRRFLTFCDLGYTDTKAALSSKVCL